MWQRFLERLSDLFGGLDAPDSGRSPPEYVRQPSCEWPNTDDVREDEDGTVWVPARDPNIGRGHIFWTVISKAGIKTLVLYGGAYEHRPESIPGIKMAPEVAGGWDIACFTDDFSVPDETHLRLALLQLYHHTVTQSDRVVWFYVGCKGGQGRTGLFMAAWAKLMMVQGHLKEQDPIEYVRQHYLPAAVETPEQERYVRHLDLDTLIV